MTTEPPTDPKALWRAQETETAPMTLAQIHARAFQTRVRWRNGIEYVASVFVVASFGWSAVISPWPIMRAGDVMVILATLIVVWQLHRRGSARAVPAAHSLTFHRDQLVRQRDALRSVWLWYLAPFVPGMLTILVARGLAPPHDWRRVLVGFLVMAILFLLVFALNWFGARRLQKHIDELDALKTGD
jgi:amino acid transporter